MYEILSIENSPAKRTRNLGELGESLAADYLVQNGFRLVVANFKVPVGRNSVGTQVTGEIDIIAIEGDVLCFIEVKTRRSAEFTPVLANVDLRKQRQITRTARVYRRVFKLWEMKHRYDVVTVLMPKGEEPEIEIVKGFWHEGKFRKRNWNHEIWHDFV